MSVVRKIMNVAKNYYKRYRCHVNPVEYAHNLGVKVGKGTKFYGAKFNMFSTEPWVVSIGENCHITADVLFMTHDAGTLIVEEECGEFVIVGDIVVGNNVYIGTRSTILPGVRIGDNTIIGAGSVIAKDIPANVVAAGVPCRVIGTRDKYINKVKDIMNGDNTRYYSDLEYLHSLNPRRRNGKNDNKA